MSFVIYVSLSLGVFECVSSFQLRFDWQINIYDKNGSILSLNSEFKWEWDGKKESDRDKINYL